MNSALAKVSAIVCNITMVVLRNYTTHLDQSSVEKKNTALESFKKTGQ